MCLSGGKSKMPYYYGFFWQTQPDPSFPHLLYGLVNVITSISYERNEIQPVVVRWLLAGDRDVWDFGSGQ